jgi:exonuclease III
MKILLWNTEWAKPDTPRGKYIQNFAKDYEPKIICYTEAEKGIHPTNGHLIESESDYGYSNTQGRSKVTLWSTDPWSNVDEIGHINLPSGRFISGITNGIRFVGVCIPWKDAHVKTGRRDKSPWEDHLSYLSALSEVLNGYLKEDHPVCVIGDYNQRIPRKTQPESIYLALQKILNKGFQVSTAEKEDNDGKLLIDHISVSSDLTCNIDDIHPKTTPEGLRLSDHVGILGTISEKKETKNQESLELRIYRCYANLAMAHSAVEDQAKSYSRKHFMIRSRLQKGLETGKMKIGSIFDDEKEKMKSDTCCCFCGSTENLSIDHLIPRKKGGIDEGDNLILACRSCNSSKGKKDLMEWYDFKGEFPPLLIFRRYLKLLIKYCANQNLMEMNWDEAQNLDIPFSLKDVVGRKIDFSSITLILHIHAQENPTTPH